MKKHRWLLAGVVAGISALAVSSCAYDPYYSGGSSYSGGYGSGYGYGNSSFSTSFFVSTGNSRWGYDPYAGAYYDYTRRCYYDPYLYGYYPTGYRPRYVQGAPHPHGWTSGRGSIAPPSRIRSYNLNNYQNRTETYRGLGRDWSRNVSTAPSGRNQSTTYGRNQSSPSSGGSRFNQGSIFGGGNQSYPPQRSGNFRGNNDNDGNSRRGGSNFGRGNVSPQPPVVAPQRSGVFGRSAAANPAAVAQRNAALQEAMSRRSRPQPQGAPPTQQRVSPQPQVAPQGDGNGRGFRGSGGGGRSEEGRGRGRGPIGLGQG